MLAQGQACDHVCRGGLPGPWFARVSGRACASAPVRFGDPLLTSMVCNSSLRGQRSNLPHTVGMVFGNGETSFKKAGFPDVGTLTIYGLVDEPFDVKKLGAGRSRDTYIVNEQVIVKIEVQAPPGSANTAEVISYGGRDDWRTNEHEYGTILEDSANTFSPYVMEPGLSYGCITNKWGEGDTSVCVVSGTSGSSRFAGHHRGVCI